MHNQRDHELIRKILPSRTYFWTPSSEETRILIMRAADGAVKVQYCPMGFESEPAFGSMSSRALGDQGFWLKGHL